MLNDNLKGRLFNWKFHSAASLLDDQATESEDDRVRTLDRLFGNCGWFDGDMSELIAMALESLIGTEEPKCKD